MKGFKESGSLPCQRWHFISPCTTPSSLFPQLHVSNNYSTPACAENPADALMDNSCYTAANECVCVCAHSNLVMCVCVCVCSYHALLLHSNPVLSSGQQSWRLLLLLRCVFDVTAAPSCVGHLVMWHQLRGGQTFWLVGHNVQHNLTEGFMSVENEQRQTCN